MELVYKEHQTDVLIGLLSIEIQQSKSRKSPEIWKPAEFISVSKIIFRNAEIQGTNIFELSKDSIELLHH